MKGQVLFRQLKWNAPYPNDDTGIAYAGVGVVEMQAGMLPIESLLSIIWQGDGFWLTGEQRPARKDYAYYELSDHITNTDFSAPASFTGLGGGSLLLRKTRKKSATPGNGIYLALIVVRNIEQDFEHRTIYNFSQENGSCYKVVPERQVDFETNGMAMAQIHKSPIWGWDQEKWGPVSTMSLEAIDEVHAYLEREDAGIPQPESVHTELRWLMKPRNDPQYDQFKRRMREEGHLLRWDEFQTQSQAKIHEQAAESIVREILQSEAA